MRILPELVILNPPISSEPNMISPALLTGVNPKAFCLALKVTQSAEVNAPVKVEDAFCKLMVPAATCKFVPTCKTPLAAAVPS